MAPDKEPRDQLNQQFLKRIPDLVDRSFFGREGRTRQARQALIQRAGGSVFYDPVLVAVEAIQQKMISTRDSGVQGSAAELLKDIIREAGVNFPEGRVTKTLNLTPEVMRTVDNIVRNGQKIQRDPKLVSTLPPSYKRLVDEVPSFVKASLDAGHTRVEITFSHPVKPGEDLSKRDDERKRWQQWSSNISSLTDQQTFRLRDAEAVDNFIDLVKAEPKQSVFIEKKLFTTEYAGLSPSSIEQLPYPISPEDYLKIISYLTAIFSNSPSQFRASLVDVLFFQPVFFSQPTGLNEYRNKPILSRLSSFQEQLVQNIMVQQNEDVDDKLRELLKLLPQSSTMSLLSSLYIWFTHPHALDPEFSGKLDDRRPYFIYDQAIADYQELHPDEIIPSKYGDEIAIDYFKAKVLPTLEERLRVLGVEDNFRSSMQFLKRMLEEKTFAEEHLHAVRDVFEKNSGEEFLQKLKEYSSEIDKVTETVLRSVLDENMHFLPMQQGINTINFSPNSVPDVLGLKSISFNRIGDVDDWQLTVVYSFSDTHFRLLGFLDKDGKIRFKAPIEQEISGLYTILRHIAVLTFRDLVVQDKIEQQERGTDHLEKPEKDETHRNGETPSRNVSQGGILPREQTDRQLTDYIFRKTGITPRIVEVHPASLPGAKEYLGCVKAYQNAIDNNLPEGEILERKQNLELARQRAYQTSEAKKKTVPARFKLATVPDPVTGQERYLETWVIEHTVPKPTEDELRSPVKLYERYYKGSSSLAFLEQLKPWFVGAE